jgi:hypothetical protein
MEDYLTSFSEDLERLVERHLDIKIDSIALRLFIQAYWGQVSLYARTIHDET